jgi:transcription initiation factor IIE alpha subunit
MEGTLMKCTYDPTTLLGKPIGMFHCPECGEMVIAGLPHPEELTDEELQVLIQEENNEKEKEKG